MKDGKPAWLSTNMRNVTKPVSKHAYLQTCMLHKCCERINHTRILLSKSTENVKFSHYGMHNQVLLKTCVGSVIASVVTCTEKQASRGTDTTFGAFLVYGDNSAFADWCDTVTRYQRKCLTCNRKRKQPRTFGSFGASKIGKTQRLQDTWWHLRENAMFCGMDKLRWTTVCWVIMYAPIGTLVRELLQALFGPNGAIASVLADGTVLYLDLSANMLGSFLLGSHTAWRRRRPHHVSGGISAAFSTGFCGCLTSFSSWSQNCNELFVTGQVAQAILSLILGIWIPVGCYVSGYDLGLRLLPPLSRRPAIKEPTCCNNPMVLFVLPLLVYAVIVIPVVAVTVEDLKSATSKELASDTWLVRAIALLYSAPGALIRYFLSLWLNKPNPSACCKERIAMPYGTFTANVLGATFNSIVQLINLSRGYSTVASKSFTLGFNGSLSTVSTLMKELVNMHNPSAIPTRWNSMLSVLPDPIEVQEEDFLKEEFENGGQDPSGPELASPASPEAIALHTEQPNANAEKRAAPPAEPPAELGPLRPQPIPVIA
eukprot:g246.t1